MDGDVCPSAEARVQALKRSVMKSDKTVTMGRALLALSVVMLGSSTSLRADDTENIPNRL